MCPGRCVHPIPLLTSAAPPLPCGALLRPTAGHVLRGSPPRAPPATGSDEVPRAAPRHGLEAERLVELPGAHSGRELSESTVLPPLLVDSEEEKCVQQAFRNSNDCEWALGLTGLSQECRGCALPLRALATIPDRAAACCPSPAAGPHCRAAAVRHAGAASQRQVVIPPRHWGRGPGASSAAAC